jgi:hypothetical protein
LIERGVGFLAADVRHDYKSRNVTIPQPSAYPPDLGVPGGVSLRSPVLITAV